MAVPSAIIEGYVWEILRRGIFIPPPSHQWATPKNPILNSVKEFVNPNLGGL